MIEERAEARCKPRVQATVQKTPKSADLGLPSQLLQEASPVIYLHLHLHQSLLPGCKSLCVTLPRAEFLDKCFPPPATSGGLFTVWEAPKSLPLGDCGFCIPTFPFSPPCQPEDPARAGDFYILVKSKFRSQQRESEAVPGDLHLDGVCLPLESPGTKAELTSPGRTKFPAAAPRKAGTRFTVKTKQKCSQNCILLDPQEPRSSPDNVVVMTQAKMVQTNACV